MKILVCSEKCAFSLKDPVVEYLRNLGYEIDDISLREDGSDRPYYEIGEIVGELISNGVYEYAIVLCGSGMGVAMATNRYEGVYCAVCESVYTTVMSRGINNANVLALGVFTITPHMGCQMARAFLESNFPDSAPEGIDRDALMAAYKELKKIDFKAHHR